MGANQFFDTIHVEDCVVVEQDEEFTSRSGRPLVVGFGKALVVFVLYGEDG